MIYNSIPYQLILVVVFTSVMFNLAPDHTENTVSKNYTVSAKMNLVFIENGTIDSIRNDSVQLNENNIK